MWPQRPDGKRRGTLNDSKRTRTAPAIEFPPAFWRRVAILLTTTPHTTNIVDRVIYFVFKLATNHRSGIHFACAVFETLLGGHCRTLSSAFLVSTAPVGLIEARGSPPSDLAHFVSCHNGCSGYVCVAGYRVPSGTSEAGSKRIFENSEASCPRTRHRRACSPRRQWPL